MSDANEIAPSDVALLSATITEVTLPEDYELVQYTLRRKSDGMLQSYQAPYRPLVYTGPLPATPVDTPNVGVLQWSRDNSDSATPTPLLTANSHQQLFNIPIRGGRERSTAADTNNRTVSAMTQKRHDESGENGYTIACGVICPDVAPPVQKFKQGGGDFYCPRCLSNYTRPKTVKDHFTGCVSRYGNPLGLRYNDHESMPSRKAALQSRESSSTSAEQVDNMTDVDDQEIKTEFVYGADIALRSIESHDQEQAPWSPNWRRQSETPNPGYVPAATPSWEFGMGYVPGQTPAPVSRASTPVSSHSGSVTPTPGQQQSSDRTPTPAPWPSRDSSEETEEVDDGDSMEY